MKRKWLSRAFVGLAIASLVALSVMFGLQYCSDQLVVTYVGVARSDMRIVGLALEAFHTDHGRYPDPVAYDSLVERSVPSDLAFLQVPDPGSTVSAGLTTPVAYMFSHMRDAFAPKSPNHSKDRREPTPLNYRIDGRNWIVYSAGPDRDYDLKTPDDFTDGLTTRSITVLKNTYDATNGTMSSGDITLTGGAN